jgi:hypothetical protein
MFQWIPKPLPLRDFILLLLVTWTILFSWLTLSLIHSLINNAESSVDLIGKIVETDSETILLLREMADGATQSTEIHGRTVDIIGKLITRIEAIRDDIRTGKNMVFDTTYISLTKKYDSLLVDLKNQKQLSLEESLRTLNIFEKQLESARKEFSEYRQTA